MEFSRRAFIGSAAAALATVLCIVGGFPTPGNSTIERLSAISSDEDSQRSPFSAPRIARSPAPSRYVESTYRTGSSSRPASTRRLGRELNTVDCKAIGICEKSKFSLGYTTVSVTP